MAAGMLPSHPGQSGKAVQLPFVTQDHNSGRQLDLDLFRESYYPGDVSVLILEMILL